jgi:PIN domain nuclease of toxin-antitoxin system
VLLWLLTDDRRVDPETRAVLRDREQYVAVSAVSPWEIEIKRATGKLDAPRDLPERLRELGFAPLSITVEHGVAAGKLPLHHRDPFDRMLIAQAQLEGLTIVTTDPRFEPYAVPTMPA